MVAFFLELVLQPGIQRQIFLAIGALRDRQRDAVEMHFDLFLGHAGRKVRPLLGLRWWTSNWQVPPACGNVTLRLASGGAGGRERGQLEVHKEAPSLRENPHFSTGLTWKHMAALDTTSH